MKYLIAIIFAISLGHAQEVATNIESVTVYLNRAEMLRTGSQNLNPGEYTLVFTGISRHTVDNSIQVSAGSGIIQTVTPRLNYLYNQPKTAAHQALEDSMELMKQELAMLLDKEAVLKEERISLLENDNLKSEDGMELAQLQAMARLYSSRLGELQKSIQTLMDQRTELEKTKNRINRELKRLNAERNQPIKEIVVQYKALQSGQVPFKLRYLVEQAGWSAKYDIRSDGVGEPLVFFMKAAVTNSTGIDWKQVKLNLSTANPATSAVAPELGMWSIYKYQEMAYKAKADRKESARIAYTEAEEVEEEYMDADEGFGDYAIEDMEQPIIETASSYTQTMETDLSVEYKIDLKYDIPSDKQSHTVSVTDYKLEASYRYYCAPKLCSSAFLQAEVTDWQGLDLLPGPANIFLAQRFVGNTNVSPGTTDDTLRLGMGVDDNVVITRDNDLDFSQRRSLGSKKEVQRGYIITLRNNKTVGINLVVEDQMPLSTHNKIEVEPNEVPDAEYDKKDGKLTWTMDLAPGARKELRFGFTVKHPKDMSVRGL